jgi:hypothetical protein
LLDANQHPRIIGSHVYAESDCAAYAKMRIQQAEHTGHRAAHRDCKTGIVNPERLDLSPPTARCPDQSSRSAGIPWSCAWQSSPTQHIEACRLIRGRPARFLQVEALFQSAAAQNGGPVLILKTWSSFDACVAQRPAIAQAQDHCRSQRAYFGRSWSARAGFA